MPQIGEFARHQTGFIGRIRTVTLNLEIAIVEAGPSEAENAPDYRLHAGSDDGPAIGAGWKRSGEKAGEYVSIQIDDPAFARPIHANLFQNGDDERSWSLQWSRSRDRGKKD